MLRLKAASGVAALAAALSLSGCAAAFSGYDVGPSGLPRAEESLRRDLAHQPARAYAAVIGGELELPEDDLLRLLYAGTAGRYAGACLEGGHLLDMASYLAEDRVTVRLSQQALSLITSDRALDYTPSATERLMIPYIAAATYVEGGDLEGAAVEARRIEALLDRTTDDEGTDGRGNAERRFFHTLAGALFEAAGQRGSAEVSYRRAGLDEDAAAVEARGPVPGDSIGEVIVLVESGYVPHRVEQSVVIVLPGWQVARLTDGSAGEKAGAAAEAAARILATASHRYGDRSAYYHDRGYQRDVRLDPWEHEDCGDDDCDDADPYLLRISWPVLYQQAAGPPAVRVRAGELGGDPEVRLDVAAATRRDFEAERPVMIARTVARAASKVALSAAAKEAVETKDEAAGHVVGILTNLGTLLTERADTRSWHLLPASVTLVRLRLPPGTHDLELELDGAGRTATLGTIEVGAGRTTVVTHRIWQ